MLPTSQSAGDWFDDSNGSAGEVRRYPQLGQHVLGLPGALLRGARAGIACGEMVFRRGDIHITDRIVRAIQGGRAPSRTGHRISDHFYQRQGAETLHSRPSDCDCDWTVLAVSNHRHLLRQSSRADDDAGELALAAPALFSSEP